jgi:type II secretory pathway component PulF
MKLNANLDFFDRITTQDTMFFARYLAIMLKSGFPLSEALATIAKQSKNIRFRKIVKKIQADVESGKSLFEAMEHHEDVFDTVTLSLVKTGEESGNLEKNMFYVAESLKKKGEFAAKVGGALLYPGIVLTVAATAGIFVSIFVLPKLVDLFNSLSVKVPVSTQILIGFATIMKYYGVLIVLGFATIIWMIRYVLKTSVAVRYRWESLLLRTPLISSFIRNSEMATICRNLGIMVKSGLTLVTAFTVVRDSTTNLVYRQVLGHVVKNIEKGNSAYEVFMKESEDVIPRLAARMIGVGGNTGKVEDSFEYLASFFEEEVDAYAKNLGTILEPALLLLVGLVVAFVVSAMLMPIYDLSSSVSTQ